MEVAGGAIAIVSLGIQLVSTVKEASRLIHSIRNAPDEVSALGASLEQLHLTLAKVTFLIEQQQKHTDISASTDLLECAVRNCEPNVTKFGRLVDKLQRKFRHDGKYRTAWASISSVMKKDDVDQYRMCIQGDLTALNYAVALNALELNLHQTSIINALQTPISTLAASQALQTQISSSTITFAPDEKLQHMEPSFSCRSPEQKRRSREVMHRRSIVLAYWGLFGSAYFKTKSTSLCLPQQEETQIFREKTFTIHPWFLQRAIEVRYQRDGGRVSRSLRYHPILPYDSKVFKICINGDLEGFKKALIRNEVPISGQLSDGSSLLHCACINANAELCLLLIQLGVDPGHVNILGATALEIFSIFANRQGSCVETTIRLLGSSQANLTEKNIDRCLECYEGPPEGLECILSPDVYPVELDWHHLPLKTLLTAIHLFSRDATEWTNLVRKIVRLSADLHRVHHKWRGYYDRLPLEPYQNLTLLDELFVYTYDTIEGAAMARTWLSILATEGHDVTRYLKTEMALHADQKFKILSPRGEADDRKLSFYFTDEPTVEWDWWINPEASASFLCNEFKHMIRRFDYIIDESEWERTWPFLIPKWSAWLGCCSHSPDERKQIIALANSRAARRAEKKRTKIARAEGTHRPTRIPGAWID